MKRVFIIHGWQEHPEDAWFPWLKEQLKSKGFEVFVPQMPNTDYPKIEEWVPYIKELVGTPDKNTFFVGHSIGCQTILRYLQDICLKVGGAVFVAGWINLKSDTIEAEGEETVEIAKPWIETSLYYEKIRENCDKIVALFSTNDPYVPFSDSELFKDKLGAKVIIYENKGHLGGEDGISDLPVVVDEIVKMANP